MLDGTCAPPQEASREAILKRRIQYVDANGQRLQEHLDQVKKLKEELEEELLNVELEGARDEDEEEEDDDDDESTPLVGNTSSILAAAQGDEADEDGKIGRDGALFSSASRQNFRSSAPRQRRRLQTARSQGEITAAESSIMRNIPKIPERIPTDHFQGHGSDMILRDEGQMQLNYEVLGLPTVRATTLRNLVLTAAYSVYLMTAWFYCGAVQERIFPSCSHAWPTSTIGYTGCQASALLFWTFPLYCALLTVLFFYYDFLHTELFYQCLAHNVVVDYENRAFFTSISVMSALLWLALGCMTYFLSGEFDFDRVKLTIPYWIPILSFAMLFLSSWDIEDRLLSLQKYLEKDFENSVYHLSSCTYLRDYILRQGVIAYEENAQVDDTHGAGQYLYGVVQAIEKLEEDNKVGTRTHETLFEALGFRYWISVMLKHMSMVDSARCRSFLRWFLLYRVLVVFLICITIYLGAVDTALHHLNRRGELTNNVSWLDAWLGIEREVQKSMAPKPPKLLFLTQPSHV